MYTEQNNYLCHYGVPGMKWGRRKRYVPVAVDKRRTRLSRGQRESANRKLAVGVVKSAFKGKLTRSEGKRALNQYLDNHAKTKISSIALTTAATAGAGILASYLVPTALSAIDSRFVKNTQVTQVLQNVSRQVPALIKKYVISDAVAAGVGAAAMKGVGMLNNKRLDKKKVQQGGG